MSPTGKMDAISNEALHNKAFTGMPKDLFFASPDKSLKEIPCSLRPVKKEPGPSLFFAEVFVTDSEDVHEVETTNRIRNRYLNMN